VDEGLQHERSIGYLAVPDLPIVVPMFAHHDCLHNQLVSFHNRVCGFVTVAEDVAMRRLTSYMVRLASSLPTIQPWSLEQVVLSYHGPKRSRYEQAASEYRAHGLTKSQANVKMFIKCEKIQYQAGSTKPNPDPRAIQFRNPVFAVVLAQYIKPMEDVVYRLRGNRLNNLPPTPVFGKSLDSKQKADLLKQKWDTFRRPVAVSLDASRFDQHIDVPHLLALHKFYKVLCNDPYLDQLLSWTIVNKVTSTKGLKYVARGGRMSGDMDTALGACTLMLSMLGLYFEGSSVHWECLDDGDDIILLMESEMFDDDERVKLTAHFLSLGQEIKIENVAYELEKVVWCQASPVWVGDCYKFIRNPIKVLSGALVGPKWVQMHSDGARRALANSIGLGEGHINKGVPVLQSFALAIIRNADTQRQIRVDQGDSLFYKVRKELGKSCMTKIPTFEPGPVTDEARASFALAFDISITDQLHYENYFDSWNFSFSSPQLQPPPVDVPTWCWNADEIEKC